MLESNFVAPINVEMAVGTRRAEHHGQRRTVRSSTCRRASGARSSTARCSAVAPDRSQLRDDGRHRAGRVDRPVRRRRLDGDVGRRQPHGPRIVERRFPDPDRRDDRRRDVRRRPVLVRLRQRSADPGNRRPGQRRRRRKPAVGRARQPHSADRRQQVRGRIRDELRQHQPVEPEHRCGSGGARLHACRRSCIRQYDINYTVDGPIVKDRLWFFISGRNWAYNNYVGGAVNPDGSQAIDDNNIKAFPARLTAQLTPKNKVTAMFDWSDKVRGHANLSGHDRARSQPGAEPAGPAHRAGEMDVDADQSPAARNRLQPDVQQRDVPVRTRGGPRPPATPPSTSARRAPATAASRIRT